MKEQKEKRTEGEPDRDLKTFMFSISSYSWFDTNNHTDSPHLLLEVMM